MDTSLQFQSSDWLTCLTYKFVILHNNLIVNIATNSYAKTPQKR
jgi:hypothetical protein